jgi:ribosomal-protein-alanine N-acetyltransferase
MSSPGPITVRAFAEPDRSFFQRVVHRLLPDVPVSPRDPAIMRRFMDDLAAGTEPLPPGTEILVAADAAGQPLGLLAIHLDTDHFTRHPRAYVEILVVATEAEGRGVGRALMERAEAWGRERGCREVVLDVFADNEAAVAFYQRIGFRPDHIRMSKSLPADRA